jgi:hypothetical protein
MQLSLEPESAQLSHNVLGEWADEVPAERTQPATVAVDPRIVLVPAPEVENTPSFSAIRM